MCELHKIDNKIILEMTLPELERSAVQAFPDTRKRQHSTDTVTVSGLMFVPMQNALLVKAELRNTDGGKVYDVQVLIDDVTYENQDAPDNVTFTGSDGQEYTVRQIDLNRAQVKVICNCLDFYWRFATWNFGKGSLLGKKPAPYVKRTDRPPTNPKQMPGVCKHLMELLKELRQSNLFRS